MPCWWPSEYEIKKSCLEHIWPYESIEWIKIPKTYTPSFYKEKKVPYHVEQEIQQIYSRLLKIFPFLNSPHLSCTHLFGKKLVAFSTFANDYMLLFKPLKGQQGFALENRKAIFI